MLISADNLQFGFNGGSLLENVTFTLSENERVGLIGGNGEGKTTLIRLMLGELETESGTLVQKNGKGFFVFDLNNPNTEFNKQFFNWQQQNGIDCIKYRMDYCNTNHCNFGT